jgi:hypothetical protein
MFVKMYNAGDPSDPGKQITTDGDDKLKDSLDPNADPDKGQPDKDPEKQPDKSVDTIDKAEHEKLKKEHENLKDFHSKYQGETTAKLQKLAKYEEAEKEREAKRVDDQEISEIDDRIAETEKEIQRSKTPDADGRTYDTTALQNSLLLLKGKKRDTLRERAREAEDTEYARFVFNHPDFKDFTSIAKIRAEARKKGSHISYDVAYEIYEKEQEIAKLKDSAKIDAENKDLSKNAGGEGGDLPPDKSGEEANDATFKFYKEHYGEEKAKAMLGMK